MKKPIDAKALREKIEGLYKNADLTQSDERLLRNERASLQYQDPVFRADWEAKDKEARDKKEADPVFRAARVERGKKIVKDHKRNQKISKTVSAQYQNPDTGPAFKEFKSATIKDAFKDPEKLANLRNGTKTREENGWEEKNAEAAKKRRKPIQTPYGRFESKGDAVKAMSAAGEGNAGGKLSVWLKTKPTEYYYIET
jgi:hypothetical protein